MPKVGIDLRMVRGRLHGIARYALELARRVPPLAPDWEFIGLTGPDGLSSGAGALEPKIPLVRCPAGYLSPLEQPMLLASLIKLSCDLFHATSFSLPGLWRGRLVATLHDVNHLVFPENYGPGRVAYYRLIVAPRARAARAVMTDSDFSRQEISKYLDIGLDRLEVVRPGVDTSYRPSDPAKLNAFRRAWKIPERYFAAVGTVKPHKNLLFLARIASSLPAPVALLAGAGAKEKLGFPTSTVELAEVPEEEMSLFYGGALGLLFPSRYEGFGLPPLEAMACRCPVIASNASSLPEIIGDAGILLSPDDDEGWILAARRLCTDDGLRNEMADRGAARALQFSWDHCASQVLAVYKRALQNPSS